MYRLFQCFPEINHMNLLRTVYFSVLKIHTKIYTLKEETTWVRGMGNGTRCFALFIQYSFVF